MDRIKEILFVERNQSDFKDFEWAFGLNRLTLDLLGAWPVHHDDAHKRSKMNLKHWRTPTIVIWMLTAAFLPQMYALYLVYQELSLVVENLTTSCAALTSSLKIFFLWSNSTVLESVVIKAIDDWSREKTPQEYEIMTKQAGVARFFTKTGYGIMFFSVLTFITIPIFGISIRTINNITDPVVDRVFPLQTYYPYEATVSPYYQLTYLSQMIAGGFIGITFSVSDFLFGALVFHVSGQYEILALGMENLIPGEEKSEVLQWLEVEKQMLRMKMRQLINTHVHLIRYVNAVEKSFNLLILAHVICLSLIICFLGFGVVTSVGVGMERPPFVQIASLSGSVINLLIHMLIYCYASEVLAKHSVEFFHAVYGSYWYLLPVSLSRQIIPMLVRSKSNLHLTAGKFFYLSLGAYLNILKSSAGYISMLLTVNT